MLDRFRRWLARQAPDVYHQHGWTRGCGVHHLQAARDLGVATVTTLHVPAAVCLRDTMLLDGESVCDGRIDVARCTRCWGRSRGIPMGVSALLGELPAGARLLSGVLPDGVRLQTAAMTPALVEAHRARFERLVSASDRVVVVCDWLKAACLANGAPPDKLVMSRQGVDDRFVDDMSDRGAVTSPERPAANRISRTPRPGERRGHPRRRGRGASCHDGRRARHPRAAAG